MSVAATHTRDLLRPALAALGAALLVGVGPELWKRVFERPPPVGYAIAVYASSGGLEPLPQADVTLTLGDGRVEQRQTSPAGVAVFVLDAAHAGRSARLDVRLQGYGSIVGRRVTVPLASTQESVYLLPAARVEQLSQLAAAHAERQKLLEALKAIAGDDEARRRARDLQDRVGKLQVHAAQFEVVKVFSSGPRESGARNAWSAPYEVCSEPTAPGLVIRSVAFHLRGERSCGAWAECGEARRSADTVCWVFRLQGLPDQPVSHRAFSEGVLAVTYGAAF